MIAVREGGPHQSSKSDNRLLLLSSLRCGFSLFTSLSADLCWWIGSGAASSASWKHQHDLPVGQVPPYCSLCGLILNRYKESSSAKENSQLASTHHSFLLDQLLSFLCVGVDTWHRAFPHAFASSSLAGGIIPWAKRPWSNSQSVPALWACRTNERAKRQQRQLFLPGDNDAQN